MSIATDNRVKELEEWRVKAEAARLRFEAEMERFKARLEEIARTRVEVRDGKPR